MHAKMKYRKKMGVETENYEIAAKGFENTDFVVCISTIFESCCEPPIFARGLFKGPVQI